jgi:hypothetical protein
MLGGNSDDFTAKLMEDMDPKLLEFVRTKVNSFIKWDLIRFFHDNPNTVDTAGNIAKCFGRSAVTVEPELEELVTSGVMEKHFASDMSIYSLAQDEEIHKLIDDFVTACDDRHFRVKAVYHIIRGMR